MVLITICIIPGAPSLPPEVGAMFSVTGVVGFATSPVAISAVSADPNKLPLVRSIV
jgi:hypothetical protein